MRCDLAWDVFLTRMRKPIDRVVCSAWTTECDIDQPPIRKAFNSKPKTNGRVDYLIYSARPFARNHPNFSKSCVEMFAQQLSSHPAMGTESPMEVMWRRPDGKPDAMTIRRSAVKRVFDTIEYWLRTAHLQTRTLGRMSRDMSLPVLAYKPKRVMKTLGIGAEGMTKVLGEGLRLKPRQLFSLAMLTDERATHRWH
jgi:hypothetical protein